MSLLPPKTARDALDGLSALLLIAWGVVLFLPGNTFSISPSYMRMAMIAPEEAWASAFLLGGVGLITSGMVPLLHRLRRAFAMLAAVLWGVPAACFGIPPAPVLAPIVYGAFAFAMLWSSRTDQD